MWNPYGLQTNLISLLTACLKDTWKFLFQFSGWNSILKCSERSFYHSIPDKFQSSSFMSASFLGCIFPRQILVAKSDGNFCCTKISKVRAYSTAGMGPWSVSSDAMQVQPPWDLYSWRDEGWIYPYGFRNYRSKWTPLKFKMDHPKKNGHRWDDVTLSNFVIGLQLKRKVSVGIMFL